MTNAKYQVQYLHYFSKQNFQGKGEAAIVAAAKDVAAVVKKKKKKWQELGIRTYFLVSIYQRREKETNKTSLHSEHCHFKCLKTNILFPEFSFSFKIMLTFLHWNQGIN